MKKILYFIIFLTTIFYNIPHSAKEVEIFADSIDQDSNGNIVAKGNVKIIDGEEILTSSIVIINQDLNKIILPKEFQFKDNLENYTYGSSGEFSTNFENGIINDVKMLLNDGSRIVGKVGYKTGEQDLISKGVFSPCSSKINIKNFVCPIWQLEGEKILHDRNKLFVHTKHAKMRIFNTPVYYFPYMIHPSPLRKERKSGFLNPSIATNFLSTKTSQSLSTPYYFVIAEDKELLLTPTINYGGGVDASQRITYDYYQLTSGGYIKIDASTDTNLEKDDNENWLRDASIILKTEHNINENYTMSIESALQTSPTYLRRTNQNNPLNRKSSLSSTFKLNGYETLEPNDTLIFTIAGYQIVRNNEDNKTTPTAFPNISYISGSHNFKGNIFKNHLTFYNLFRDTSTDDHAQQQQKIAYTLKSKNEFYWLYSKLTFNTELHSQFYNIENKKIGNKDYSGTYSRIFPMTGLFFHTPIVNKKYNLGVTPFLFGILNSSQPNSNKISNEDSTDYKYDLLNSSSLNRYSGNDKLDNSKRLGYGLNMNLKKIHLELSQAYEFDLQNNDFTKNAGLYDYMSDLLGSAKYDGGGNDLIYGFRFNVDQGLMKSQTLTLNNGSFLGLFGLTYYEERQEVNTILETGTETLGFTFQSKDFFNYSSMNANATFDLVTDDPTGYSLGYRYFDECFGVNIDFGRSFYEDRDLKPKDMLTVMFSFKHLGSYKSTNIAVSEWDKQDIKWESSNIGDGAFK